MPFMSRILGAAAVSAMAAFAAGAAVASPQALGLVATYGDVELKCEGATCTADFTAFCLQKERDTPHAGTPYFLVDGEIRLTGTTAAGETVALDAGSALRIESRRQYFAVRLTVPRQAVEAAGATRVAVNVLDGVVLLPETPVGDATPHSRAEVAMLGEKMRAIGTDYVDADLQRMAAARILGDVINGLPERGKGSRELRERLWNDAVGNRRGNTPARAIDRARGIYELCGWTAGRGTPNMRDCLEGQHDDMIRFLNGEYWRASRPQI
ncbi:MAG: hypothetical protein VW405_06640 [Rhodospirillaceae bacterium]